MASNPITQTIESKTTLGTKRVSGPASGAASWYWRMALALLDWNCNSDRDVIKERHRGNYAGPTSGNYRTRSKVVKVKQAKDMRFRFEVTLRSVYAPGTDMKVLNWMAYLLRRCDHTGE